MNNNEYCKNTKYALFGLTIHEGHFLRGGHYFSIIKRNNRWYQCNDSKVIELMPSLIEHGNYIIFDKLDTDRIFRNGYLFFYRRYN